MITPKNKIGYIRRLRNEDKESYKLIVAKVQKVVIGKKATKVYTKEFYPLDMEEIESNTRMIDTSRGFILLGEPFVIDDEDIPYFQAVVDDFNGNGAKSIWEG